MIEYMLVMRVDPADGRRFYHRIFVDMLDSERMDADRVVRHEREEAKKLYVNVSDLVTVNVVKLQ